MDNNSGGIKKKKVTKKDRKKITSSIENSINSREKIYYCAFVCMMNKELSIDFMNYK